MIIFLFYPLLFSFFPSTVFIPPPQHSDAALLLPERRQAPPLDAVAPPLGPRGGAGRRPLGRGGGGGGRRLQRPRARPQRPQEVLLPLPARLHGRGLLVRGVLLLQQRRRQEEVPLQVQVQLTLQVPLPLQGGRRRGQEKLQQGHQHRAAPQAGQAGTVDGEADGGNAAQTTGACLALPPRRELSSRSDQMDPRLAFLFFSLEKYAQRRVGCLFQASLAGV